MKAEGREPDIWFQQDYRVASLMVAMAEEGRRPSYERAFMRLFGKQAKDVTAGLGKLSGVWQNWRTAPARWRWPIKPKKFSAGLEWSRFQAWGMCHLQRQEQ